jgi:hypothetical protein
MFPWITGVARVLRPRALARTAKGVEQLLEESRQLRRALKSASKANEELDARTRVLQGAVDALRQAVADVQVRERQLQAIYERDVELESYLAELPTLLDVDVISRHARAAIADAPLHEKPLPYIVVENVWPDVFYEALIRGLPPLQLFAGQPMNKQRLVVPFTFAPAYSRRVWDFLVQKVLDRVLADVVVEKFRDPLDAWLRRDWSGPGESPSAAVRFQTTDGRILLRTRGYHIPPHRDPKWGFITCLMYLVRPGDSEHWGTQLFSVADDHEASNISPLWVESGRCRLAEEIPFRRNSMLIFLNSTGAHGARIPDDAEPEGLQRYVYQFRIGPTPASIRALMGRLPDARRPVWAGKVGEPSEDAGARY